MEIRNILTVAYFVLAMYTFGGGVMGTVVYYQSWRLFSSEDFSAVHKSVSDRILPYFFPLLLLLVVVNILLILVSQSGDFHMVDRTSQRRLTYLLW